MNQFFTWLAMGGYSAYVWPAYGLVGVVLILNLVEVKWKKKRIQRMLQQWFRQ